MKTIEYVEGMVVSEPCIVKGGPIEWYHGKPTKEPGVSSSGLRTFERQSPAHYYARSPYNPNRVEEKDKAHLNFGQATHTKLLEPGKFAEQFSVRPVEFKDWRTNAAREWRDAEKAKGKTVITPEDDAVIDGMRASLAQHPLIQAGILQGEVERSLFWPDKKTGVWLKARPDVLPSADGVVVDLKTTTDASPEAVKRTISEYAYPMQGALVGEGIEQLLGFKMTDFVLVFIEKEPPYAVNVTVVDPEWLHWAQRQLRRSIDIFAECLKTGHWPGYEGESTASMPDWMRKKFEFEDQNGLLPEVA